MHPAAKEMSNPLSLRRTLTLFSARMDALKGQTAFKLYQTTRQKRYLAASIEHYRHACETSDEFDESYARYLVNYASVVNVYDQTFARTNRKVIRLLERAHGFFERREPRGYAEFLNELGQCYLNQYKSTKENADYRRAIGAFEEARLSLSSSSSSSTPASMPYLKSLIGTAVALWTSCDIQPQFDDFRVLQQAITHLEQVAQQSSVLEAECCLHLGSIYAHLYDSSLENFHYLNKSIETSKRAVELLASRRFHSSSSQLRAMALFNLAESQCRRYADVKKSKEGMGADAMDDLDEAENSVMESSRLVRRGYGTRELQQNIEDLVRYIDSCKSVVEGEDGERELDNRPPCSMSRYYLRTL